MGLFGRPNIGRLRAAGDVAGLADALNRAAQHDRPSEGIIEAGNALVELGDPGVEALVQSVRTNDRLRHHLDGTLTEVMRRARGHRAVELLDATLGDPDPDVRRAAVRLLWEPGDEGAADALARALTDVDASVRQAAALGLARRHDRRAIAPLRHYALHGPYPYPGPAAVTALGDLDDDEAARALLAVVRSAEAAGHDHVRTNAQRGLDRIAAHTGTRTEALVARLTAPAAESASALLARWEHAPPGTCDLCSAPITDEHSRKVPNDEFRDAVMHGYDPFERGHVGEVSSALAAMSGGPEVAYLQWIGTVMTDPTDWGLCPDCAADLAGFLAADIGASA